MFTSVSALKTIEGFANGLPQCKSSVVCVAYINVYTVDKWQILKSACACNCCCCCLKCTEIKLHFVSLATPKIFENELTT